MAYNGCVIRNSEGTMELEITVENRHTETEEQERIPDPEEALRILEEIRLQSGKFIYEYPARLRRTIEVIRRK